MPAFTVGVYRGKQKLALQRGDDCALSPSDSRLVLLTGHWGRLSSMLLSHNCLGCNLLRTLHSHPFLHDNLLQTPECKDCYLCWLAWHDRAAATAATAAPCIMSDKSANTNLSLASRVRTGADQDSLD